MTLLESARSRAAFLAPIPVMDTRFLHDLLLRTTVSPQRWQTVRSALFVVRIDAVRMGDALVAGELRRTALAMREVERE